MAAPKGLNERQAKRYEYLMKHGREKEAKESAKAWKSGKQPAGKSLTDQYFNVSRQPWETPGGVAVRGSEEQLAAESLQGQKALMGRAVEGLQNAPSAYSNIQDIGQFDPDKMRQEYTQRAFENYMRNIEPYMMQEREDFEQMAANRGWTPGSEIYEKEKNRLLQQQELQKQNILQQAYATAGEEARGDYRTAGEMLAPRMGLEAGKRYGTVTDIAALRGVMPDISDYYKTKAAAYEAEKQRAHEKALAKMKGGGGGGVFYYPSNPPLTEVPQGQGGGSSIGSVIGQAVLPPIASGLAAGAVGALTDFFKNPPKWF